jgi:hypothetical protein
VLDRDLRARDGVADESRHHATVLDAGGVVVDRQHERAAVQRLLDRGTLVSFRRPLVARRLRLAIVHLPDGIDDLVLDVVEITSPQMQAEYEKTRLELDVDEIEHPDLVGPGGRSFRDANEPAG